MKAIANQKLGSYRCNDSFLSYELLLGFSNLQWSVLRGITQYREQFLKLKQRVTQTKVNTAHKNRRKSENYILTLLIRETSNKYFIT